MTLMMQQMLAFMLSIAVKSLERLLPQAIMLCMTE
jgi:hypothetical protein